MRCRMVIFSGPMRMSLTIRIATLYSVLASLAPSPVVELNRAVAVSMADGPAAGLAIADTLAGEPALRGYHLLPSVRGDLLERLGRRDEAHAEFQRAAVMGCQHKRARSPAGPRRCLRLTRGGP